jgi:hypothetical protein
MSREAELGIRQLAGKTFDKKLDSIRIEMKEHSCRAVRKTHKGATMNQAKTTEKRVDQTLWPVCKYCKSELRRLDTIKIYSGTATVKPRDELFRVIDNKDEREDKNFETDYFCPECGELVHLISAKEQNKYRDSHRTVIVTRS